MLRAKASDPILSVRIQWLLVEILDISCILGVDTLKLNTAKRQGESVPEKKGTHTEAFLLLV